MGLHVLKLYYSAMTTCRMRILTLCVGVLLAAEANAAALDDTLEGRWDGLLITTAFGQECKGPILMHFGGGRRIKCQFSEEEFGLFTYKNNRLSIFLKTSNSTATLLSIENTSETRDEHGRLVKLDGTVAFSYAQPDGLSSGTRIRLTRTNDQPLSEARPVDVPPEDSSIACVKAVFAHYYLPWPIGPLDSHVSYFVCTALEEGIFRAASKFEPAIGLPQDGVRVSADQGRLVISLILQAPPTEYDRRRNNILMKWLSGVASSLESVWGTNAPRIALKLEESQGLPALGVIAADSLRSDFIDATGRIRLPKVWERITTSLQGLDELTIDVASVKDGNDEKAAVTRWRRITNSPPDIVQAERIAITLHRRAIADKLADEGVDLGVSYHRIRRQASSRKWASVDEIRRVFLSTPNSNGVVTNSVMFDDRVLRALVTGLRKEALQ